MAVLVDDLGDSPDTLSFHSNADSNVIMATSVTMFAGFVIYSHMLPLDQSIIASSARVYCRTAVAATTVRSYIYEIPHGSTVGTRMDDSLVTFDTTATGAREANSADKFVMQPNKSYVVGMEGVGGNPALSGMGFGISARVVAHYLSLTPMPTTLDFSVPGNLYTSDIPSIAYLSSSGASLL